MTHLPSKTESRPYLRYFHQSMSATRTGQDIKRTKHPRTRAAEFTHDTAYRTHFIDALSDIDAGCDAGIDALRTAVYTKPGQPTGRLTTCTLNSYTEDAYSAPSTRNKSVELRELPVNHSSDITPFTGVNYGSNLAETSGFGVAGAVGVVDLGESSVPDFDVALMTHARQWARSPEIYALILELSSARSLIHSHRTSPLAKIHDLLQLYWRLDCFPKPLISLLNAPLDAATAGLTTFGTHRVAGESYRFSVCPGNGIPAAGVAYALARAPSALARELVLTGRSLARDEAWAAGLVTHCIPSSAFPEIVAALADGQPVDPLLDGLHEDPSPQPPRAEMVTPPATGLTVGERSAIEKLILAAGQMDVHDSLVATYRIANALHSLVGQDELNSTDVLFSTPETGDLRLALRSQL